MPVCTTVVPLLFPEAAPKAAPAAAPFATGWELCCSSAGGGGAGCVSAGGAGCAAGGCCAGCCVCDDACGAIAVVTAIAVITSMSVFKALIRPPIRRPLFRSNGPARPRVVVDASCYREIHCRDNSTYYEAYRCHKSEVHFPLAVSSRRRALVRPEYSSVSRRQQVYWPHRANGGMNRRRPDKMVEGWEYTTSLRQRRLYGRTDKEDQGSSWGP